MRCVGAGYGPVLLLLSCWLMSAAQRLQSSGLFDRTRTIGQDLTVTSDSSLAG